MTTTEIETDAAEIQMRRDLKGRTVLEQIGELSSAEDFFTFFLLPFEQSIVSVNRLHIMKRMGQYLKDANFDGMSEDDIFLGARLLLKQAYTDFIESTPVQEKVFKVFTDQEKALAEKFVSIDGVDLGSAD